MGQLRKSTALLLACLARETSVAPRFLHRLHCAHPPIPVSRDCLSKGRSISSLEPTGGQSPPLPLVSCPLLFGSLGFVAWHSRVWLGEEVRWLGQTLPLPSSGAQSCTGLHALGRVIVPLNPGRGDPLGIECCSLCTSPTLCTHQLLLVPRARAQSSLPPPQPSLVYLDIYFLQF